ncbi:MAG: hypothetical protein IRY83_03425 [Chloroflexi bacterium]|nr:hypothetical protein [Chloroflexota bacterium]
MATHGHLVFARGASRVTIHADPSLSGLYRAHFAGPLPDVQAQDGTVTILYRHIAFFGWLYSWHDAVADIALNPTVPWDVDIRGGASKVTADLRGIRLRSFTVIGGASNVELWLPRPIGTVSIRVSGGVSKVSIFRPPGVAARIRIGGGFSRLSLDGRRPVSQEGRAQLETPDYPGAIDRYDVGVEGGASRVSVDVLRRDSSPESF